MATTQMIHGYTAAVSVSATSDYLLIDPGSTGNYNKITRNVLLGITGAPLGTTDSQVVTNKTVGITNTITALDSTFSIVDNGDNTKVAQFQASGITTGTTRTYTLPNASDTLVGKATTDTLTNKTLTSPVINGGTIDNSTITVDSISGHTTSTIVSVGGVQMNNGVISTAGAVTSASILAGAVQPLALVSGTGSSWAWTAWTPTYSNLTVGNGVHSSSFIQIGKTVIAIIQFTFGTTSVMGTNPSFTLPVTASSRPSTALNPYLGQVRFLDSGVAGYPGIIYYASTTAAGFFAIGTAAANGTEAGVTATVPLAWGLADGFAGTFMYEAA